MADNQPTFAGIRSFAGCDLVVASSAGGLHSNSNRTVGELYYATISSPIVFFLRFRADVVLNDERA